MKENRNFLETRQRLFSFFSHQHTSWLSIPHQFFMVHLGAHSAAKSKIYVLVERSQPEDYGKRVPKTNYVPVLGSGSSFLGKKQRGRQVSFGQIFCLSVISGKGSNGSLDSVWWLSVKTNFFSNYEHLIGKLKWMPVRWLGSVKGNHSMSVN